MVVSYDEKLFQRMYSAQLEEWNRPLYRFDIDYTENIMSPGEKLKFLAYEQYREIKRTYNMTVDDTIQETKTITASNEARVSYIGNYTDDDLSTAVQLLEELLTGDGITIDSLETFRRETGDEKVTVGIRISVTAPAQGVI